MCVNKIYISVLERNDANCRSPQQTLLQKCNMKDWFSFLDFFHKNFDNKAYYDNKKILKTFQHALFYYNGYHDKDSLIKKNQMTMQN